MANAGMLATSAALRQQGGYGTTIRRIVLILAGGFPVPKDLRTFLAEISERRPDDLRMITEEIEPRFGIHAVAAKLERQGQFPALYFSNIQGSDLPVVVNLTATYERLAIALGTTVPNMVKTYAEQQANPVAPKEVETGPVKEVILKGADADLRRLPIPTHNKLDGGPCITSGSL